jgi:hypothetical protein
VNHGLHPGGFLSRIIEGDVDSALKHADPTRKENLSEIIEMVNQEVPSKFRGSEEALNQCISEGGIS